MSQFASTSNIRNVFLINKMEINNEQKKKVKTKNIKEIRNLSIISKEEFK
jgi:hypothetical protein